ncbi:hypothetical protein LAZ67_6002135 [Cordylochernes scorpioides]|uniref:CCHC-type domain-containing protein n=1 Tax=Cordylochernes scorpioides TaxID=51811 RepID=A0ABY6KJK4_9ARAC|nr:hypothetical protein LAZ67_6002135 [Cordylochernes scorpioides]
MATNLAQAESPSNAEKKPVRHGEKAQPCAELSKKEDLQKKSSNLFGKSQGYANPPAGGHHANPATPTDFVTASFSETAAQANRSWADLAEDNNHESENPFITVQRKKRRRGSAESPAAAAPSSNIRGAGAIRRPRSSTGWAPRAEEVRTTRAHIAEARARQASSTEDHCVYIERSPELEPYHYMRALDRMLGGTREVFQMTKMNGHFLVGLANRGLAERLVNEGLEVEGTLHRAFPFRKRAERITVGNLPFFVGDAAVISALSSFGRVTSIAPKLMKAGPYVYNDGRREAFIILREGMTIKRLPTRRTTAPGPATPTSPTSVPPATAPRLPQQPSARPPPPASPSSTMEVSDVPPASRAAPLPPAALQPSPPAPSALPLEDTPPAPPPVTPAPSLRAPGSREPAAPTPDVEMSIVEETFASSTSSAKNATRVDLDAFIEELPSVSFAKTDALGLGREELLDLLSSRTKAQRKGPLLSPPQCDALVSLIGQILDLKPGHTSNLYKVLGQVRAELTKTPAAAPTPPLPAPRPDGPIPPPPHGDTTTPDMATSPSPLSTQMDRALMDKRWEGLRDLMNQLDREFELDLEHRFQSRVDEDDIIRAILYPGDREPLIKRLPTRDSPEAAPSSNPGGSRTIRRPQPSAHSVPRAQENPTTRAHIAEARARQASSAEEHCVYLEHGPELQPFHYLRALDRLLGGTAGVVQVSKVNGHQLLGLANRGLAERLINNGLEVEGTLLGVFPFRKRAERITVGNLPFFVEDAAIIKALGPYGRITSIAPKMMKAGPYTYTDGRREAFIVLHDGVTTERLPTRLNITIKGEAWPAYLSSGIKCSRCHGQGHLRANCPLLAGRTTAPGPATPTSPTSVPPATAPRLPQQPSAQPPPPASPSPTMEVSDVPPTSRAALHPPAALRQPPPAPSALPAEDAPPAPPPVTPAPSLRTPGSREPAAPTPDVEMSIVEETSASSTSSAKNATRIDLDAFIERHPSVSFAGTDALGLGREEVLDFLSSRTKAQRNRPLLSPPQGDALAGLIGQILDLRPGAASNLYKVLGQVKAELRTTPAAVPTPPLPAPRPAEPAPPAPHGKKTTPDMATPPPPPSPRFIDERWREAHDIIYALGREPYSEHLSELRLSEGDITDAVICPEDREPLLRSLSTRRKNLLAEIISATIERAWDIHPFALTACTACRVRHRQGARDLLDRSLEGPASHLLLVERNQRKTILIEKSIKKTITREYVNPPADGGNANLAAARADVISGVAATSSSNGAALAIRNWADCDEVVNPGTDDDFTVVKTKKRRRESANSPTAAAPPSNIGGARTSRRPQSSAGSVPRAQEVRTTRAHITEARARQASSSEDHCVYLEHGPELQPFHYLRALDRTLGGTAGVIQISKVNGHQLLGLANRGLAECLINEGLEVEGTLLRAFPFRKRAERITVGNLTFFVEDSAIISALKPYGRVTSIAPKLMKAGPYTYNDGRREAFIVLREGMTTDHVGILRRVLHHYHFE